MQKESENRITHKTKYKTKEEEEKQKWPTAAKAESTQVEEKSPKVIAILQKHRSFCSKS